MSAASSINPQRFWSLWGDRLLAVLAALLVLGLAWVWVGTFYLGQPINEILSFDADDSGLLGQEAQSRIVLGTHTFGDFQAWPVWANLVSQGEYPNPPPPYLPISFMYGSLFVSLKPLLAVLIHQGLTAALIAVAGSLLLAPLPWSRRVIILVLTTFLTIPMISTLDTGNIQGLILGLLMVSLALLQRGKPMLAAIALGIAISFKGYPALVLLWPLAIGRWKFATTAMSIGVGISIFTFLVLPGGFLLNLERYVQGVLIRPAQGMIDAESSLRGFVSKCIGMLMGADVSAVSSSLPLIVGLSAFWIAAVFLILRTQVLPEWAAGTLALSTLQMAVPTTYNYALGWASLAALWFGVGIIVSRTTPRSSRQVRSPSHDIMLRWAGLVAIVATLAPIGYRLAVNNVVINVSTMLSPLFVVLFLGTCSYVVLREKSSPLVPEVTHT